MNDVKFDRIVDSYLTLLRTTLALPPDGSQGALVAYNAYLEDTEVVVLGHQTRAEGSTWTRPVAIFVTEEVFDRLVVDDEAGRKVGDEQRPAQVRAKS